MDRKNKPIILVVDDAPESLDILVSLLEDYDVRDVTDGKTALEIVESETIDLILLDIQMPEMNGYEVCQKLKENPISKDIPLIFITAEDDDNAIEKAYKIGGRDYITKPFRPLELIARVEAQLALRELVNKLTEFAYYDPLTGIYNRRRFFELGNLMFAENDATTSIMIDIDNFKSINDGFGHAAGDEIIKMVTRTIAAATPEGVLFGRLGGEEFALLCSGHSREGASAWIEFIRKQIEHTTVEHESNQLNCTISAGVASKESKTSSLDELLNQADKTLYLAKSAGKNQTRSNFSND